jgi:hypothetical protein
LGRGVDEMMSVQDHPESHREMLRPCLEDLRRWFEWVLQGVPEGIWAHIQDEEVLDQCVGVPTEWQTLIHREAVGGKL